MAGKEQIKFSNERPTFFSKKSSRTEDAPQSKPQPPTVNTKPTVNTTPSALGEVMSPTVQPVNQPIQQIPQPLSAGRPLFKNSSMQNTPLPQSQPGSQQVISPSVPRERLPDEVPLVFTPAKYKVFNPTLKFEYRRTQIELKLGHIDQEEGEVMTVFIGPDYKESRDVAKLAQLCEYDLVKCLTEAKPRAGKVMPLTSKSFDRFSGLFVVYLEDKIGRSDIVDALSNLFRQVDENEVEEICIPVPKSRLYTGSRDELANCLIDEALTFLSNRSRESRPTQISWLQFITDEPEMFYELTRVYAEAIEKVSANQNLIVVRAS